MFQVDVKGMFLCCQRALRTMLHSHSGSIVNLSSIWGSAAPPARSTTRRPKRRSSGLTKALAQELGPSHIRVNCVAPGVINTEMNGLLGEETLATLAEETPLGILGEPEDVAKAVLFLAGKKPIHHRPGFKPQWRVCHITARGKRKHSFCRAFFFLKTSLKTAFSIFFLGIFQKEVLQNASPYIFLFSFDV